MHRPEHAGAQVKEELMILPGPWALHLERKIYALWETTRPDLFRGATGELKKQLAVGFLKLIRKQNRSGWGRVDLKPTLNF